MIEIANKKKIVPDPVSHSCVLPMDTNAYVEIDIPNNFLMRVHWSGRLSAVISAHQERDFITVEYVRKDGEHEGECSDTVEVSPFGDQIIGLGVGFYMFPAGSTPLKVYPGSTRGEAWRISPIVRYEDCPKLETAGTSSNRQN